MGLIHFVKRGFQIPFQWTVRPKGNIREGDCVITHAAGRDVLGEPGMINRLLARTLMEIQSYFDCPLPVFAQGDFASCVPPEQLVMQTPWQEAPEFERRQWLESLGFTVKPGKKPYIQTMHIATWHKVMLQRTKLKRPILLTYNPHMVRAYWASLKVGLDVIVPKLPRALYDPYNSQAWMRKRTSNGAREIVARCKDLLQGRI